MSWKRRWSIIGALALAQVGVVVCYQGFFKGSAAPAGQPAEQKVVPAAALPQAPVAPPKDYGVALPLAAVEAPPSKQEPGTLPIALVDSAPLVPVPVVQEKEGKLIPVGAAEVVPVERLKPMPVESPADANNGWARNPTFQGNVTVVQVGAPPSPVPGAPLPGPANPPVSPPTTSNNDAKAPMTPAMPPLPKNPDPPGLLQSPPPTQSPIVAAPQTPEPPAADLANCPWILRVEIVKGRTLMTARSGKDVQFRISCDKLELQAPRGSIVASGNVSVSSEGLQGACDHLTIVWTKDHVMLEGMAELKCQRDGQELDLKAAKLSLRLTAKGVEATQATTSTQTQKVRLRPHPITVEEPSTGAVSASYNQAEGREPPMSEQPKPRKRSIKMPEID